MSRSGTKRGTGVKHLATGDPRRAACGRVGELSRASRAGLLALASACPQKACKRCLAVLASGGARLVPLMCCAIGCPNDLDCAEHAAFNAAQPED
jgi:hypothetical protein